MRVLYTQVFDGAALPHLTRLCMEARPWLLGVPIAFLVFSLLMLFRPRITAEFVMFYAAVLVLLFSFVFFTVAIAVLLPWIRVGC